MTLLDLVDGVAAAPRRALSAHDVRSSAPDWRAAESALLARVAAEPASADRLVRAFERVADVADCAEARGRARRLHASALAFRGAHGASVPLYENAIAELRGAAKDGARIGLAGALLRIGRFAEAVSVARAVRSAARRRGEPALSAAAALNLGIALLESGAAEPSLDALCESRRGFLALGLESHAARAGESLANALVRLDRFVPAEALLGDVSTTFARLGHRTEAAHASYNHGVLLAATDRPGEALDAFARAEEVFRETGDRVTVALVRVDRAEVLLRANLLPEALREVTRARDRSGGLRTAAPLERERARLLHARIALASGDVDTALRLLRAPVAADAAWLAAESDELRGRAHVVAGRLSRGRRAFLLAAARFGRAHPVGRARALASAAGIASLESDSIAAFRTIRRAERLANALDLPSLSFVVHATRFDVERRAGRADPATLALERTFAALERVRAGGLSDPVRSAVLAGSEAWFARALRHLLDTVGDESRAESLLTTWRARAFQELLAGAGTAEADGRKVGDVRGLRLRLSALERKLEDVSGPAFLRARGTRAPARATELAAAVRAAEADLGAALARVPGGRRAARPASRVARGTVLVTPFADAQGGVAFVRDARGTRVVRALPSEERVRELLEELRYRLGAFALGPDVRERRARRLRVETERVLDALSAEFLAPLAPWLRGAERLVVVPTGPWYGVPFAALRLPDGRRLIEAVSLAVAPAPLTDRGGALRPRGTLVLAAGDDDTPGMEREAHAVARCLRDTRVLTGDDARAAAVATARGLACLHIAAHGRFRPDAPHLSGVRLADGWLRGVDFCAMDLRGALVVLSGCETGVADVRALGEADGLVRGVLASGAAGLLASLWKVDDVATSAFMTAFHERRAAGDGAEQALAGAQRAFAAAGAHPWLWAGFQLFTAAVREHRAPRRGRA